MPALDTPPGLSAATSANLHAAALAGRSPLDTLPTSATPPARQDAADLGVDDGAPPSRLPMDGLKSAQNKDQGIAPPDDDGPPPAPAAPSKKPDQRIPNPATPAPADKPTEWSPKNPEAKKHWEAMKAEAAALRAELDKAKAAPPPPQSDPAEVEELRKQVDTYQRELRDVAIERDPQFKQRFEPRRAAAIDAAKNAAGDAGDKLSKLMAQPQSDLRDQQIEKLTEDLSAGAKRRIDAALGVLEGLDIERETEIAASRATYDQRVKQQEQQSRLQTQQREAKLKGALKSEISAWTDAKEGSFLMKPIEGNEAHNAAVQERIQQAENLFNGSATPEALANAVMWAVNGPALLEYAQSVINERDQYKAHLDGIRGTTPGAGRDGQPSGHEDAPQPGSAGYSGHFQSGLAAAQQADRGRG